MSNANFESEITGQVGFLRSIQGQIMILMLVLGLLPLLVLGIISSVTIQNTLRETTQSQISSLAESRKVEIEQWFEDTIKLTIIFSELPILTGNVGSSSLSGAEYLARYRNNPEYAEEYQALYSEILNTSTVMDHNFDRIDGMAIIGLDASILFSTVPDALPDGSDFLITSDTAPLAFEEGLKGVHITEIFVGLDGVTPFSSLACL